MLLVEISIVAFQENFVIFRWVSLHQK